MAFRDPQLCPHPLLAAGQAGVGLAGPTESGEASAECVRRGGGSGPTAILGSPGCSPPPWVALLQGPGPGLVGRASGEKRALGTWSVLEPSSATEALGPPKTPGPASLRGLSGGEGKRQL